MIDRAGRVVRSAAAVMVVGAGALAACGGDTPTVALGAPPDLADHRGQFVVDCAWSHSAPDDPIVHPDDPGASHLHDFFGNVDVNAGSQAADLASADTTCQSKADRASYWAPALLDGSGEPVTPVRIDAYYRAGRGVDPATVEPYPYGLQVLGGDPAAESQPTSIVGWSCSRNPLRYSSPPECSGDLHLRITFPDCWDGEHLRLPDNRSHVVYSDAEGCPDSHSVAVPQLEMVVTYPVGGDVSDHRLAPGDPTTAHADFWNLWDPDALEREVRACINDDVVCGIATN